MDRRQALKRIIGGTTAITAAPMLVSSTAFADGGSRPTSMPTPPTTSSLSGSNSGSRKYWLRITPSFSPLPGTTPATCPAGDTSTVEYRWELVSGPAGHGLYAASSGGSPLSTGFSSSLVQPVYVRALGGGHLLAGTYSARLTVRYICALGSSTDWSCQSSVINVSWITGGGSSGTITSQNSVAINPPDNSPSCDSPAP